VPAVEPGEKQMTGAETEPTKTEGAADATTDPVGVAARKQGREAAAGASRGCRGRRVPGMWRDEEGL